MFYLYVKTHNITKLKYLGKTKSDPFKYNGSGKYWNFHIAKHGLDIHTEIIGIFETNQELRIFSEKYSLENDIVNSKEWANLKPELGDGGAGPFNLEANRLNASKGGLARALLKLPSPTKGRKGYKLSDETRKRMSDSHKGKSSGMKGKSGWNKGLTKDDPRVKANVDKMRITKSGTKRVYKPDGTFTYQKIVPPSQQQD